MSLIHVIVFASFMPQRSPARVDSVEDFKAYLDRVKTALEKRKDDWELRCRVRTLYFVFNDPSANASACLWEEG